MHLQRRVLFNDCLGGRVDINRLRMVIVKNQADYQPVQTFQQRILLQAQVGEFTMNIERAAQANLPYVYLGYWVDGSPRMQYKVRYRPLERLTREGWERMPESEQSQLIAAATAPRDKSAGTMNGARGKDGQPVKFPASLASRA